MAWVAVTDEAGFAQMLAAAQTDPSGFVDAGAEELATVRPAEAYTLRKRRIALIRSSSFSVVSVLFS